MVSAAEELRLQKLEELVFDEDKIVTIAVLCQELEVSIKDAKELLEKYVSDQEINPGKIADTYLISGKLKNGEYSIEIVKGTELKEREKQYDSITDKVVHSVQKHNVVDFNLIALSEQSNDQLGALNGSLISNNSIKRNIKEKELPPLPPPKNFEKQKPSSFFKPVPKDLNGDKEKIVKDSVKELKTQPLKKTGGLANFLSQSQSTTKENTQKVKKERSDEDERESKKARIESNDSEEVKEEKVDKKVEKVVKTKDSVKSVKNKKTKKDSDKNNDKDGKKRKRIIVESDSDDDIFANAEEEKVVEVSDEEPPVNVKPKVPLTPVPKNKRRKAVEKTYEDEDGYIVTRTEYVLVSASEDEEENVVPPKENVRKPEPKEEKKISPVKGAKKKGKAVAANQPTLMNFFKKK